MVVIPAGRFRMGCVSGQGCNDTELPVHDVTIPQAFAVSKYEVTFEDYDRYTYPNRVDDGGWGRGRRPVINVSWNERAGLRGMVVGADGTHLSAVERGGMGIRGPGGLVPLPTVGATTSVGTGRTAADAAANGTMTGPRRWARLRPTVLGCTTCTAMYGSGWRIAGTAVTRGAPTDGSAWRSGGLRMARVARRFLELHPEVPPLRVPHRAHLRGPGRLRRVPRGPGRSLRQG